MAASIIPFDRIAEEQNLPAMLRAEGIEVRHGKAFCPFHDNARTPALSVYQVGGRWRFKCHGCPAKGDAITWRALRKGIEVAEAARELGHLDAPGGRVVGSARPNPPARIERPRVDPPGPWLDETWQRKAGKIIDRAADALWSRAGRPALEWLRARGLLDHTISLFRLGFIAEPRDFISEPIPVLPLDRRGDVGRIYPIRGITIPWAHPGAWYHANEPTSGPRWVGCNVRHLMPDVFAPLAESVDKCKAFAGSHRGYPYPYADLVPGIPLVLAEGEWDALIGWQEFGWIANVATVGGTKGEPKFAALDAFACCSDWLLALHNDDAGNEAVPRWEKRARGKAVRLLLPPGEDLNDMHLGGTDVLTWLRGEYKFLDWPWPSRTHGC